MLKRKKGTYTILSNRCIADHIYKLVLDGYTGFITAPGQFVNIALPNFFLRRPISISDYDNALVSLTGDVATNYILLRTLEKRLQIARDNVVVQKKGLKIATARWKGGTTSLRDVEQAKTVLDSTEAPAIEATAAVTARTTPGWA